MAQNHQTSVMTDADFETALDSFKSQEPMLGEVGELLKLMNENRIISWTEAEQIMGQQQQECTNNNTVKCSLPPQTRPSEPDNDTDVDYCIRRLNENDPQLVEVNLNNMKRTPIPHIQRLILAIRNNTILEKLSLANCNLYDANIEQSLLDVLENNDCLRSLNLETNYLSGEFFEKLFRTALVKQSLEEVKAVNQGVSFSTMAEKAIIDAIFANKRLTKVSINFRLPEGRHKVEQALLRNTEIKRILRRQATAQAATVEQAALRRKSPTNESKIDPKMTKNNIQPEIKPAIKNKTKLLMKQIEEQNSSKTEGMSSYNFYASKSQAVPIGRKSIVMEESEENALKDKMEEKSIENSNMVMKEPFPIDSSDLPKVMERVERWKKLSLNETRQNDKIETRRLKSKWKRVETLPNDVSNEVKYEDRVEEPNLKKVSLQNTITTSNDISETKSKPKWRTQEKVPQSVDVKNDEHSKVKENLKKLSLQDGKSSNEKSERISKPKWMKPEVVVSNEVPPSVAETKVEPKWKKFSLQETSMSKHNGEMFETEQKPKSQRQVCSGNDNTILSRWPPPPRNTLKISKKFLEADQSKNMSQDGFVSTARNVETSAIIVEDGTIDVNKKENVTVIPNVDEPTVKVAGASPVLIAETARKHAESKKAKEETTNGETSTTATFITSNSTSNLISANDVSSKSKKMLRRKHNGKE